MKGHFFAIVITALLGMSVQGAFAATFNVSNQTEFVSAIIAAVGNAETSPNGEDDTIIMAAGTYYGGEVPNIWENHSLTFLGAGAGKTMIVSFDPVYGGQPTFLYATYPTNDSAAHLTLKGITFQDASGVGLNWTGCDIDVTYANVTIEDCEFKNNLLSSNDPSSHGAGLDIKALGTSSIILRNNVFKNNITIDFAGAGARVDSHGPITIENNTFTGNHSSSGSGGGGLQVFAEGGTLTLSRNVFLSNIADKEGGGVSVLSSSSAVVIMVNNIFYDNSAKSSGAAQIQSGGSGDITVVNNTFYKNSADSIGGIMVMPKTGTTNIYNNILYGNIGILTHYDLFVLNDDPLDDQYQPTPVKLYNNDVNLWGVTFIDFVQQAGNINEDPKLDDCWHLIKGSPCIDSGLATAPSLPTTDIDGNPRLINSSVDIGAAEYTGAKIKPVSAWIPLLLLD
jgi:hypothetical protein